MLFLFLDIIEVRVNNNQRHLPIRSRDIWRKFDDERAFSSQDGNRRSIKDEIAVL